MVQAMAGYRGLLYGGLLGGLGCYFAGIAFPTFGRQRLPLKAFLTASGALVIPRLSVFSEWEVLLTSVVVGLIWFHAASHAVAMAWFTLSADKALLRHEAQEREFETRVRNMARLELGKKGFVATEEEIQKWKDGLRQEYYDRVAALASSANSTPQGTPGAETATGSETPSS